MRFRFTSRHLSANPSMDESQGYPTGPSPRRNITAYTSVVIANVRRIQRPAGISCVAKPPDARRRLHCSDSVCATGMVNDHIEQARERFTEGVEWVRDCCSLRLRRSVPEHPSVTDGRQAVHGGCDWPMNYNRRMRSIKLIFADRAERWAGHADAPRVAT